MFIPKAIKTITAALICGLLTTTAHAQAYEAITVAPNGAYGVGWADSETQARVNARNACPGCGEIVSAQSYGYLVAIHCIQNGFQGAFIGGGLDYGTAVNDAYSRAWASNYANWACTVIAWR